MTDQRPTDPREALLRAIERTRAVQDAAKAAKRVREADREQAVEPESPRQPSR